MARDEKAQACCSFEEGELRGVLGAVKTEFGKFGTFLDGVHKNLETATNKILLASQKSRTIERKLRGVEAPPLQETVKYLGTSADIDIEDETAVEALGKMPNLDERVGSD